MTLCQAWQFDLRSLKPNWDSYGAPMISERAIDALGSFNVTPCSDGGIQLEVHADHYDIEIVVSPEGKIQSALIAHERERSK